MSTALLSRFGPMTSEIGNGSCADLPAKVGGRLIDVGNVGAPRRPTLARRPRTATRRTKSRKRWKGRMRSRTRG